MMLFCDDFLLVMQVSVDFCLALSTFSLTVEYEGALDPQQEGCLQLRCSSASFKQMVTPI